MEFKSNGMENIQIMICDHILLVILLPELEQKAPKAIENITNVQRNVTNRSNKNNLVKFSLEP